MGARAAATLLLTATAGLAASCGSDPAGVTAALEFTVTGSGAIRE